MLHTMTSHYVGSSHPLAMLRAKIQQILVNNLKSKHLVKISATVVCQKVHTSLCLVSGHSECSVRVAPSMLRGMGVDPGLMMNWI